MATTVVGFRMGCDERARQITVLVSHSGVLYRSHGPYGKPPTLARPELSPPLYSPLPTSRGEHPLARPVVSLRNYHAQCLAQGYTRILIPPGVAVLDVDERLQVPVVPPNRPRELTEAFVGAAPAAGQSLEEAIRAFRAALGLPNRPLPLPGRQARGPLPPRARSLARALAHGRTISSAPSRAIGWTVNGEGLRLHVGHTSETLDRDAATQLNAALTAWLAFTQPNPSVGRDEPR
ncbi:hypothetical protein [Streptomyces sp. NPDC051211]|uniref:hypothetical protein n=1 Tax=Streptomyces sp. NPDC051211 TaxID=3154643 RepID=UPI00344EA276